MKERKEKKRKEIKANTFELGHGRPIADQRQTAGKGQIIRKKLLVQLEALLAHECAYAQQYPRKGFQQNGEKLN